MALSARGFDRCAKPRACTRLTSCRRMARPPAFTPMNTAAPMRHVAAEVVAHQQTTRHVVNLKATTADFKRIVARLGADTGDTSEPAPALRSQRDNGKPTSHKGSVTEPWSGLLGGLLGSLRSSQNFVQSDSVDGSNGDSSPLSHAVVMFTATWCGPCSVVYRELKLAATRLQGRAATAVLVIDVEENKELASDLGIKALPTVLYLGQDESRAPIFTQGPVSSSVILDTIDRTDSFGGRNVKAKWLKL